LRDRRGGHQDRRQRQEYEAVHSFPPLSYEGIRFLPLGDRLCAIWGKWSGFFYRFLLAVPAVARGQSGKRRTRDLPSFRKAVLARSVPIALSRGRRRHGANPPAEVSDY
jgi:hypothetical protein